MLDVLRNTGKYTN